MMHGQDICRLLLKYRRSTQFKTPKMEKRIVVSYLLLDRRECLPYNLEVCIEGRDHFRK